MTQVTKFPAKVTEVIAASGISDLSEAQKIASNYAPLFERIGEQATVMASLEKGNVAHVAQAKRIRIDLSKIVGDATRQKKTDKESILLKGRFIDSLFNTVESMARLTQSEAEAIETYFEVQEKIRIDNLRIERQGECEAFAEFIPSIIDLGVLNEQDYENLVSGAKMQLQAKLDRIQAELEAKKQREAARIEAERKAIEEAERAAAEAKAKAEAERLEREHELAKAKAETERANAAAEKARKEKEAADAAAEKERQRIEVERAEFQAKFNAERTEAERIRKEAEAKAAKERAEIQAKLDEERAAAKAAADKAAKEAAEKAAAEAKELADKIAAEKEAAKAPDKQKLVAFSKKVNALYAELPEMSTAEGLAAAEKAKGLIAKLEAYVIDFAEKL